MVWQLFVGQAGVYILEAWAVDALATDTCTALLAGFYLQDTCLAQSTTAAPPVSRTMVLYFPFDWMVTLSNCSNIL